ncbi:MAG: sortase [Ruminococcus sp.]|nr:sortase [Ruminococcus sp.]
MKNKLWKILIILGILLILSAGTLCIYNSREDKQALKASQNVMNQIHEIIPEIKQAETPTKPESGGANEDLFAPFEEEKEPEIPTIQIDDSIYCGFITLPSLGIELPVTIGWSYPSLKKTPGRYKGSVYGNDLIIAAHNYGSHFGRINELVQDDEIWFTDAEGYRHYYTVQYTEVINGWDTERMLAGNGSDWELTIYTCDYSGQNRIAVRAAKTQKD